MLTRLRLENFKAWADTGDIALKPITGFFGTNSSGKSSLIQALLLLKQTAESSDRSAAFNFGDARAYADMGDFVSVAHGHRVDSAVKVALEWNDIWPGLRLLEWFMDSAIAQSSQLGFQVAARVETVEPNRREVVEQMSYNVGDAIFGMQRIDDEEYDVFAKNVDFTFVRRKETGMPSRFFQIVSPVKCYGFPSAARVRYENADFLSDLGLELEKCLENVYYLGPLRAHPQRTYTWTGSRPYDMGRSGEYAISAILSAKERNQPISRGFENLRATLEEYVALWLRKLGLIHDFRVERIADDSPLYRVKVRKSPQAAETLITDVGFGVSQILPALVLCFYAPEGSTIILEQPEIHLHPLAQAGLADALIDAYQNRGVQIIVESHSEHLLNRIQRRIAEETISHDDVGLYFCSHGDNGASKIDALRLDEFGNIANWPKNFFGDQFGEIAAMSKAAIARQMSAGG